MQVAGKLESELLARVLTRLANQECLRREMSMEVGRAVKQRVAEIERSSGTAIAARILAATEGSTEAVVLENLGRRDRELADQIRRTMTTFDDIAWLSNPGIRTLLKNVELSTWAMALLRSSRGIAARIVQNLSRHGVQRLDEEMAYLRWASAGEIVQARRRVVEVALELLGPQPSALS